MVRPIADAVTPFLDEHMGVFVKRFRPTSDLGMRTGNEVVYRLSGNRTRTNITFPDRRAFSYILEHVDATNSFKLGTPVYSDMEKSVVKSSRLYKALPRKLAPRDTDVFIPAVVEAFMWGGDAFYEALNMDLTSRYPNVYVKSTERSRLLSTDWLMDKEIDVPEILFTFLSFWKEIAYDSTVREWVSLLSSQSTRELVGRRNGSSLGGNTNSRFRYTLERIRKMPLPKEDILHWYMLAQAPLYAAESDISVVGDLYHFLTLSKKYTPDEVASYVRDDFPPKNLGDVIEHGIDMSIFQSLMAG